jgi:SNF2 family DNA or RNA helicase
MSEDVVVMSWATMVRDLSLLEGVNWAGAFLDEAQFAKNPSTIRATSATSIPARATFPVTGTPLENRLLDLCTLLSIAAPTAFGDPAKTAAHWATQASRFGELCAPFLLRRTVDKVAKDLPPLVSYSEALAMLPSEAKHYEAIQAQFSKLDRKTNALAVITRLRRFCSHPSLDGIASDDAASVSQKYTRLCELVSKLVESGEKAIIGSPWNALSDLMVADLPRRFDVFLALIDGRTPLADRQTIVDRFSRHRGPAVLILAPRAAGQGLNITAARHVIQYVPDWNPAVQDQLTARAHRKGQEHTVFEHRLFYEGTIEEAVELLLEEKRTLASEAVIESEDKQRDARRVFDMSLRMKPKVTE